MGGGGIEPTPRGRTPRFATVLNALAASNTLASGRRWQRAAPLALSYSASEQGLGRGPPA